ncbi:MAG: hypothetical protein HYW89_01630 [Candidatus Sungiibacteriota bacterium]|uniref:Uncharacterized protein n=1 Tax=Candidatus Sungiibacteriota bacterium TaxID=2750080 RepID=A0A7T5UQ98_9BACT|nr:MAG: hypothetical protein HYW89_01630 [Candidatus Sungbacteria bacterium]
MSKKGTFVSGGLPGLGDAMTGKLAGPSLPDLTKIKGVGDLTAETDAATKRTAQVAIYLAAVPKACEDGLGVIFSMPGTPIATQTQKLLDEQVVNVQDPNVRPLARWHYAAAYVRMATQYGGATLREVVPYFIGLELLRELDFPQKSVKEGGERIGEVRYVYQGNKKVLLPAEYPHEMRGVVQSVFSGLAELDAVSRAASAERADAMEEAFLLNASRNWEDLLASLPGEHGNYVYVVNVPSGTRTFRDRETGEVKVLPAAGGKIKVRLDVAEGKPTRITAVGANSRNPGFRNWLADVVTTKTGILLSSIMEERFNLPPHVFRSTPEAARKRMSTFHVAMRRAFVGHQEVVAKKAEADKIAAKANVDWQGFTLDHKPGIAYISLRLFTLEVRETVEGKAYTRRATRDFRHAGILVERKAVKGTDPETGEERYEDQIMVLEANQTGKELFPEACYEWHTEGESYRGLTAPLGQFLRRVSGIARSVRAKEAEAAKQEKTRQWLEGAPGEAPADPEDEG